MAGRTQQQAAISATAVAARMDKAGLVVRDIIRQLNTQAEELRVARERITELERAQTEMLVWMKARQEQEEEAEAKAKAARVARRRKDGPAANEPGGSPSNDGTLR